MTDLYAATDVPLRDNLREAHATSLQMIAAPGSHWTGAERVAIAEETRIAQDCPLCAERKAALSPFSVSGEHAATDTLPAAAVDAVRRLATDPGRLTRQWFESIVEVLGAPKYVELVSVANSMIIIDSQHRAAGLPPPALPAAQPGEPDGAVNEGAVDRGAWVPISAGEDTVSATGLPGVPNIVRSMGLVPGAVALFFNTFRPHYALKDIALDISQAQAEFVASRVSAHNECFY